MTKLFKVGATGLQEVAVGRLAYEEMIQDWVATRPELLGLNLLIIGREVATAHGGFIDLLALDDEGNVVVLELKRDLTPREVVAQILDYASWVAKLSPREVQDIATRYLKDDLAIAFQKRFNAVLPDSINESHSMVIIASGFDASSQRIVRYLSEQYDIAINTAFFRVFSDGEQTFLATDWLLDQAEVTERSEAKIRNEFSIDDLLRMAAEKNVVELVNVCRTLSGAAEESPSPAYGGSLRYWLNGRMIFGVNVAGNRKRPPSGEIDVWIPPARLSEIVGVQEREIRERLMREFSASTSGATDVVIRLQSVETAQKLISTIRAWINAARADASTPV